MRERVTFVHPQAVDVDPDGLDVQPAGLAGPSAVSVRQDRLSFGLDELPLELANLLRGHRIVHLKWTSPHEYNTLEPFGSRQSPGLHVSFTPKTPGSSESPKLCDFLQMMGPMDCTEAFITATPHRRGLAESMTFYQMLEDLSAFASSAATKICPEVDSICLSRLRRLHTAVSLDFSFNSADQTLRIAAFWPLREHSLIVPGSESRRTEVGILSQGSPPNLGPNEVGLGGVLIVLGEQKPPSPVLFAAPSRHRLSNVSFSSEYLTPTGLHPTLQLNLSTNKPPVEGHDCAPYAYMTLPKSIFADRFQLEDKLFLASKNLKASRYTTLPVDLEAPEYTTKAWGSNVLLELAPPEARKEQAWSVQVPLHLRYLRPTASGYARVEVPYPAVFWACESGGEGDFSTNPFDRRQLGYDELFSPDTTFWHAAPKPLAGKRIVSSISVPVLKEEGSAWVRLGTTAVVGFGFAWVMWKLLTAWTGSNEREEPRGKKST